MASWVFPVLQSLLATSRASVTSPESAGCGGGMLVVGVIGCLDSQTRKGLKEQLGCHVISAMESTGKDSWRSVFLKNFTRARSDDRPLAASIDHGRPFRVAIPYFPRKSECG